jgi:D-tagatose-1,6-bisphosphate aldolase subunit GatZ/KbaZ
MQQQTIANLASRAPGGRRRGIASICSAHPFVIEAALQQAAEDRDTVLIEATCNQVNHRGGYTGMTPAAFRGFVFAIAEKAGLPRDKILLGGDHLGPNPWKGLPADEAIQESERMMAAFVEAGFTKIHLDTSMACRGDPVPLPEATVAARAARLAAVAERAAASAGVVPYYVIGTEVPIPGGAHETIATLEVTRPQAAIATAASHRDAFAAAGVGAAYDRVIALVVQPGVEFGSGNVVPYVREKAADLSAALGALPGLVFEAHSTDYQSSECLGALVQDGFAILKVGPWLTFAMRETLYGLDAIVRFLRPQTPSLIDAMEQVMLAKPADWRPYYGGSADEQHIARHFSYSDRIRYYWPQPPARAAVDHLLLGLRDVALPETLVSQCLPRLYERVRSRTLAVEPRALITESIKDVLRTYAAACH